MKAVFSVAACLCALLAAPAAAVADLVLTYDVNVIQSSVNVGDTVNWQIFATISGTPNVGTNLGLATASVHLSESQGETLSPGTVDPAFGFPGYGFNSGGTTQPPGLFNVGAFAGQQSGFTTATAPGSYLLASGQFVATQAGLHTLQALAGPDTSRFFNTLGQQNTGGNAPAYDQVFFGNDTFQVNAVPEPSTIALYGLAVLGGWRFRRRRPAPQSAA